MQNHSNLLFSELIVSKICKGLSMVSIYDILRDTKGLLQPNKNVLLIG